MSLQLHVSANKAGTVRLAVLGATKQGIFWTQVAQIFIELLKLGEMFKIIKRKVC